MNDDHTSSDRAAHHSNPKIAIPGEGVWMLIGAVIGYLVPVTNWLGIDIRLWAFFVVGVGSLDLLLATRILKLVFGEPSAQGWTIAGVANATISMKTVTRDKAMGYLALALFAKAGICGGVLTGQVIQLITGR